MKNHLVLIIHYIFIPIPLYLVALAFNNIVNLGIWGIIFYLLLYGFYYFARVSLREFVRKIGHLAVAISIITTTLYIGWVLFYRFPMNVSIGWAIFMLIRVLLVWNILFLILYLGDKYLNFSNQMLKYTSEASMPFYILHQPIIIIIGFYIYSLDWFVLVKVLFLVPLAFASIMFLFHFIIRKNNHLRLLFGLMGRKKESISQNPTQVSNF